MQQYHSSFSIDGQLVKTLSKYYMLCKTNLKKDVLNLLLIQRLI